MRIFRIVTSQMTGAIHLKNYLLLCNDSHEHFVIGDNVSPLSKLYPHVRFLDVPIKRRISVFYDLYTLFYLFITFRKYQPDIVHSIMPKAGLLVALAATLSGVPVRIHTFTGQVWVNYSKFKKSFFKGIDGLILRLNTYCLSDSFSQSLFLRSEKLLFQNDIIPVLLNGSLSGVNLSVFNPSLPLTQESLNLRIQYKVQSSDKVVSYIARKTTDKGAKDFLRCCEILSQQDSFNRFHYLYVGPEEEEIEVPKLKNLHVIDFVNDFHSILGITDILVVPSYREGFGSIVIEAAASGIPTVGYRITGLLDSVDNLKTGILVEPGDVEELALNTFKLLNDKRLLEAYRLECISRTESLYNSENYYSALVEIYKRLLQNV